VHHVRVALDHHLVGYPDRARCRYAADIVAAQVDQHDMLRALLGVGEQLGGDRGVLSGRGPRGRVPAIGRSVIVVPDSPHEDLGEAPDHVMIGKIEIEHVRRRVEAAQRPVERNRRRRKGPRRALRDLDLHAVAGEHVFLRAPDGFEELGFAERARQRGLRHLSGRIFLALQQFLGQWSREARAQLCKPRVRCRVRVRIARVGVDHEIELAHDVVDDGELVGDQQQHVRSSERIGLVGSKRARLDVPDGLVPEISDEPSAEAQRRRHRRNALAREPLLHERKRIGVLHALQADIVAARIAQQPADRTVHALRCARRRRGR
jgi:hypothetical protein